MSGYISLKKNVDFRRLYRRGKTYVTPSVVAYVLPNRARVNRLGITAGKKVGCAVRRNRAKRRLRALFHDYINKSDKPRHCLDVVLVARARAVDCPYDKLEKDFLRAMDTALSQIKHN